MVVSGASFDPVGDVGRDVDDVSGVEDDFFSALDAGAEGFAGGRCVIGVFFLHGAAGDEGDGAFSDDHLVGPELVAFGVAGVDADDEEGFVVAESSRVSMARPVGLALAVRLVWLRAAGGRRWCGRWGRWIGRGVGLRRVRGRGRCDGACWLLWDGQL